MTLQNKSKIILLIGNKLWNWNTVLTFKKSQLNIVGVCVYDNTFLGLPIKYIIKSIKKNGLFKVIDQILGRMFYKIINFTSDKKRLNEIFDINECKTIIKKIDIPVFFTKSYNNKKTLEWISNLGPDIIVVHSDGWVGKSVREISKSGFNIGSHPGITPNYRGAYPAFWAIYKKDWDKIGYSIFNIDGGVDTGDLLFKQKITFTENDSHMSIDWKCMKEIAKKQVDIIEMYEKTKKISLSKHTEIPKKSEYPIPGLSDYIRYVWLKRGLLN